MGSKVTRSAGMPHTNSVMNSQHPSGTRSSSDAEGDENGKETQSVTLKYETQSAYVEIDDSTTFTTANTVQNGGDLSRDPINKTRRSQSNPETGPGSDSPVNSDGSNQGNETFKIEDAACSSKGGILKNNNDVFRHNVSSHVRFDHAEESDKEEIDLDTSDSDMSHLLSGSKISLLSQTSSLGEGEMDTNPGGHRSSLLRPRSARAHRRTLSDPTGLSQQSSIESIAPLPGSPFEEALRKHTLVSSKSTSERPKLKRMNRSTYQRKKKKGEITREHEQYNITYCMMLGIRNSVSSQTVDKLLKSKTRVRARSDGPQDTAPKNILHGVPRRLNQADFMHIDRKTFDPRGTRRTPAHNLSTRFKFKDYAPEVFRRLREMFKIDDRDYMLSLCGKYNYIEFISNSKSGQFFFYSNDGHYLIKTQSKSESKFMRQILWHYYRYLADNPDSLLVQICGMHRVRLSHMGKDMHFVILKSVYSNAAARKIHTVYDLKGSTFGRIAKPNEAVFKDLDLVNSGSKFKLGPLKNEFMEQVEKDARFLSKLEIMDYSLLVGIHNTLARTYSVSTNETTGKMDKLTGQSSRSLASMKSASVRRLQIDTKVATNTALKLSPKSSPTGPPAECTRVTAVSSADCADEKSMENSLSPFKVAATTITTTATPRAPSLYSPKGRSGPVQTSKRRKGFPVPPEVVQQWFEERDNGSQHKLVHASSAHQLHSCSPSSPGTVGNASTEAADSSPKLRNSLPAALNPKRVANFLRNNIAGSAETIPKGLELEDIDEYYYEDSEDELDEEKELPDCKFSPITARDAEGNAGTEIYYFGVIDILQQYNTRKRAENIVKSAMQGGEDDISSVNPRKYAQRFVRFIRDHVE